MSRYFPQAAYAEDQPYSTTILTAHTLYRGAQVGTVLGAPIGIIRGIRQVRKANAAIPLANTALGTTPRVLSNVLRSTGTGAAWGVGLMVPALIARMWGREEIEWKDRSWRILANEGQVEVDDWSGIGMGAGALLAGIRESTTSASGKGMLLRVWGGANLGGMAGVLGYMLYRYGMNEGKERSKR